MAETKEASKSAIEMGSIAEPLFREANITASEPNSEGEVTVKIDPFMYGGLSAAEAKQVKAAVKFARDYSEDFVTRAGEIAQDILKKDKKVTKVVVKNSDRAVKLTASAYRAKEQRVGAIVKGEAPVTETKPYLSVTCKSTSEFLARQSHVKETRLELMKNVK